ncbi:hypothetical protein P8605_04705 [Streptomyces sp. T-3]|nr:hypothetical protein [Streptomyces sp. T-3]
MLPLRLLWRDPRPVPRYNRQDPVTQIVRAPGFYEPTVEDRCPTVGYFCQTHNGPYLHQTCGEEAHLIALSCAVHGLESMWPQPFMLMFHQGFDPPPSDAELAWAEAQLAAW